MALVITGLSDSAKVPMFYGETLFGQSAIRFGSISLKCLVVGLKSSSGTIAADTEVKRVLSKEDADTYGGAGSEVSRMCYAALEETKGLGGFELYMAAPTGFGGASATLTITVTGTASAAGTLKFWVGGDLVEVAVANLDAQNTVAASINTAFGAVAGAARLPVTAGVSTNAVTLTVKQAGIRGNDLICYADFSLAPGITLALGGAGADVTQTTTLRGRKFGSGTGTETLTNLLTTLYPAQYDFVAIAQNDATSLAAWELQCDAKAGPTEGRIEHFVAASNGAFAAATSLAQTTLNNARFSLKWLELSERAPSEVAAAVACLRAALEGTTPNKSYDDYAYRYLVPQRFQSDWVTSYAEKQAALDVGVSPLRSAPDGKVYEVRSITTRCKDVNGTPDYRTLDTSESFVPDYVRRRVGTVWTSEFKVANPYTAPNPATSEKDRPAGVATPDLWNARVYRELLEMERENILTQVALNPPSSEYNSAANRIMTAIPVVPTPANHSCGVSVRQLNVST